MLKIHTFGNIRCWRAFPSRHSSHFRVKNAAGHLRRSTSRLIYTSCTGFQFAQQSSKSCAGWCRPTTSTTVAALRACPAWRRLQIHHHVYFVCAVLGRVMSSATSDEIRNRRTVFSYSRHENNSQNTLDKTTLSLSLSAFKRKLKTILFSRSFSSHMYIVMHLCSWLYSGHKQIYLMMIMMMMMMIHSFIV